jgi:hypothetical protein
MRAAVVSWPGPKAESDVRCGRAERRRKRDLRGGIRGSIARRRWRRREFDRRRHEERSRSTQAFRGKAVAATAVARLVSRRCATRLVVTRAVVLLMNAPMVAHRGRRCPFAPGRYPRRVENGHGGGPDRERSGERTPPEWSRQCESREASDVVLIARPRIDRQQLLRVVRVRRRAGYPPRSDEESGWAEGRGEYDAVGLCRTQRCRYDRVRHRDHRNRYDGERDETVVGDGHDGCAATGVETRTLMRVVPRVIVTARRSRHPRHGRHCLTCADLHEACLA